MRLIPKDKLYLKTYQKTSKDNRSYKLYLKTYQRTDVRLYNQVYCLDIQVLSYVILSVIYIIIFNFT